MNESDVPVTQLTKTLAECIVMELGRWLEGRGVNQSGKKAELFARLEEWVRLKKSLNPS